MVCRTTLHYYSMLPIGQSLSRQFCTSRNMTSSSHLDGVEFCEIVVQERDGRCDEGIASSEK